MSLLGLDVGTSSCKGLVLRSDGEQIGVAQREYQLDFPRPGWVELDAEAVWTAVREITRELAWQAREAGDPLEAMAFSVSGDEAVTVDNAGRALAPCIMAMDVRTADLAEKWYEQPETALAYQLTGLPPAPNWPVLRLMWLRENQPATFGATRQMLCWEDYLMLRLTGTAVTDHSVAARTLAFDIRRRSWSQEVLALAGISPAMFPRSVPSGTIVGEIPPGLAGDLGLEPCVRVVTGGFDQPMAALGAGLVRPGQAVVGTGTWEALTILTAEPAIAPDLAKGGYATGCYPIGDLYYCLASNPGGGSVVRWFRDTFGSAEAEVARRTGLETFDLLMREIPDGPTGLLVLPHFEGSYTPWMDPASTGAILGLRLSTTRGEMLKGLLEGITFELLENITRLEECGIEIGPLRATGGGSRSPAWLQLKADITGRPVLPVAVSDAGCLAAACVAGAGIGTFHSAQEPLTSLARTTGVYEPRPSLHDLYRETYARYRQLYGTLRPLAPPARHHGGAL